MWIKYVTDTINNRPAAINTEHIDVIRIGTKSVQVERKSQHPDLNSVVDVLYTGDEEACNALFQAIMNAIFMRTVLFDVRHWEEARAKVGEGRPRAEQAPPDCTT